MVILGLADGPDAGAALVVDDRVVALEEQERHDQVPRSRAFPWQAIHAVLRGAGLTAADVDLVAVAGRFTPPLVVRRRPSLGGLAGQNPFSPTADLAIYLQAALRGSGFGAMEAERAAELLEGRLREKGFRMQRVVLVDLHKALAEAVYRCQPHDQMAVFTLHPMGDGAVFSVWKGKAGQLDKMWEQRGFNALHLHLARCSRALGLEPLVDDDRLFGLAGRGTPDPRLVELLRGQLRAEGPRLECEDPLQLGAFSLLSRRGSSAEAVYRTLADARPEDAAASVMANLVDVACALVRHHATALGCRTIGLGGALFENPRLVAALAETGAYDHVWTHPTPGFASLPAGAAVALAGVAPRALASPGQGEHWSDEDCARALDDERVPHGPADLGALLDAGPVARFQGRAGYGRHGMGTRSVLVRADRPDQIAAARRALGRPSEEEPLALVPGDEALPADAARISGPLRYGTVAPRAPAGFGERYPGVVAPDGRVHWSVLEPDGDPELHAASLALRARTGSGAIVAWPLATGREPPVSRPMDAIRVWRAMGLGALVVGGHAGKPR